jgi:hypothetical protein
MSLNDWEQHYVLQPADACRYVMTIMSYGNALFWAPIRDPFSALCTPATQSMLVPMRQKDTCAVACVCVFITRHFGGRKHISSSLPGFGVPYGLTRRGLR